jgi:bla regulator protein blaR1
MNDLARISVERMLYSLVEGTALALLVWLLLRLLPRRNSGTRFAVWFSVLISIMLLPFLAHSSGVAAGPAKALLTIPESWTLYIFLAWALIATAGLVRVAAGLWAIRKLRRSCIEIDPATLDPAVREIVQEFREARPLALCVSDDVQVPTAIGFLKPAVVLPAWLINEVSAAELKQVLLHELTHLRRRDDWTNLAQKIVKALLFFHPSVWWIEQRLSLDREMACDDAVISRTANARGYAHCLTHVAEKSFVRRQMALAQAAVSRVRQLSLRVGEILDAKRPGTTRLWKPAIPLVMAAASFCGVSMWNAPQLVSFSGEQPVNVSSHAVSNNEAFGVPVRAADALQNNALQKMAKPYSAGLRMSVSPQPQMVLTNAVSAHRQPALARRTQHKTVTPGFMQARATTPAQPYGGYIVRQQTVVFSMTSAGQGTWQVQMWQVQVVTPVNPKQQVPRKST